MCVYTIYCLSSSEGTMRTTTAKFNSGTGQVSCRHSTPFISLSTLLPRFDFAWQSNGNKGSIPRHDPRPRSTLMSPSSTLFHRVFILFCTIWVNINVVGLSMSRNGDATKIHSYAPAPRIAIGIFMCMCMWIACGPLWRGPLNAIFLLYFN